MKPKPIIGATAMVYGFDMVQNLRRLAPHVRHAELLLYCTPAENNFPSHAEIHALYILAQDLGITLSVHLPSMLDLVTASAARRRENRDLLCGLIHNLESLHPTGYVLHLGPHAPTLTAKPDAYLYADTARDLTYWYDTGIQALTELQKATGLGLRLLVENLDFSPLLLQPFLFLDLVGLCFDVGHVWLGNEDLTAAFIPLTQYIREIHLHGVFNGMEHLSLTALRPERLAEFNALILRQQYAGPVNLEIFSPEDFMTSLDCWANIYKDISIN